MTYKLPLSERRRYAQNKRDQYVRDPAYRLKRINGARRQRGAPEIASLSETTLRTPLVSG